MNKNLILIVLALLIISIFTTFAHASLNGTKAKNFTVKDMSGKNVSLDQYKGKIVVLNFWATWCPPCRAEMPEFHELNKELKKSNKAVLLAVNMTDGRRETKKTVEDFMKSNNLEMDVLLDTDGSASQAFGVRYLPTTYVINAKGVITGQLVGGTTKKNVEKLIQGAK